MLRIVAADTGESLEIARALFVEYAGSLEFDLDFQGFDDELAGMPGAFGPPDGRLLVAYCKERAAGCVALRKLEKSICEMKRLYVRPQFRGLRVGRALAEDVIETARRIGYTRMRLDTVPSMARAAALYQTLGFKAISPYCHNPIPGTSFLELDLSPR